MGAIISRFRKKKSTIEVLEKLEQEIGGLEKFKIKNQERQKKFIAKLLLYSILTYIVTALVFYFYYFPEKWKERLLYSIPLLLFPLIIWLVKKLLHWYFVKRIAKNDLALEELREKKKQILEDVMEKETYKKAKEILEKFDPSRFKELEGPKVTPAKPTPGTELRQRQFAQRSPPGSQVRPGFTPRPGMTPMRAPTGSSVRPGMTPFGPRVSGTGIQPRNIMNSAPINGYISPTCRRLTDLYMGKSLKTMLDPKTYSSTTDPCNTPQGPPLPRPILPRERGTMDRVLEYLVGDGPQNRYALICGNCFSHNGMAMREEFEYISFRCCYCYTINPARKKRPFAPRIEPPVPVRAPETSSQDDESDDDDVDDDEETNSADADTQDAVEGASDDDEEDMEVENADAPKEGVKQSGAPTAAQPSERVQSGENKKSD